jgi:cytosine permease
VNGWFAIACILVSSSISAPGFLLAATVVNKVGLIAAICGAFGAGLVWTVIALPLAGLGAEKHRSTYLLMEDAFGSLGGRMLSGLVLFTLLGWFAVNCGLFADLATAGGADGGG